MKREGSHWLMLSTLDCRPRKEVKIYDSVYESVSFDTQEVICNLIKYGQPPRKKRQYQSSFNGCRHARLRGGRHLWLACNCQCVVFSPGNRSNRNKLWWKGNAGTSVLTMFPYSLRSSIHKKGVKKRSILPVFCSSKRPENEFYFECTRCKIWFHPECQNMAQENISDDPQDSTYCTACQAQQVGKGEEDWIVSWCLFTNICMHNNYLCAILDFFWNSVILSK